MRVTSVLIMESTLNSKRSETMAIEPNIDKFNELIDEVVNEMLDDAGGEPVALWHAKEAVVGRIAEFKGDAQLSMMISAVFEAVDARIEDRELNADEPDLDGGFTSHPDGTGWEWFCRKKEQAA